MGAQDPGRGCSGAQQQGREQRYEGEGQQLPQASAGAGALAGAVTEAEAGAEAGAAADVLA